ncbi:hypothetical protein D3C78_527080 [compost metagenome]
MRRERGAQRPQVYSGAAAIARAAMQPFRDARPLQIRPCGKSVYLCNQLRKPPFLIKVGFCSNKDSRLCRRNRCNLVNAVCTSPMMPSIPSTSPGPVAPLGLATTVGDKAAGFLFHRLQRGCFTVTFGLSGQAMGEGRHYPASQVGAPPLRGPLGFKIGTS